MEFQQIEVSKLAKELVDIVHSYGKEAMMFLGDHWIGTEPFGKYFKNIGLDAVVGSVGDGEFHKVQELLRGAAEDGVVVTLVHDVFRAEGIARPFFKLLQNIGADAGAVAKPFHEFFPLGDGVTLRMISDIEGVTYTEGRLLPYFFPDVFTEG